MTRAASRERRRADKMRAKVSGQSSSRSAAGSLGDFGSLSPGKKELVDGDQLVDGDWIERYKLRDSDSSSHSSNAWVLEGSPAASRIRAKILYATSKQGLRRLLDGVHYEVQATDPSEMGFDVIRGRAQ